MFSNGYLTDPESTLGRYPVYKIDPAMAELCKKDKPQWIKISWEYYPGSNDLVEKHQHESIITNINFEYVYNFFFDPEKVKGQPYKPLRSPLYKEAVVVSEASEASKKTTADKNVHFFEDFSTTAIGKKPMPQNFTLTYDLVASQNFTWGAKGLTLQLSKETSPGNAESYLSLKLRPGFDGKDGEATLETKFPSPPGYSNGTK